MNDSLTNLLALAITMVVAAMTAAVGVILFWYLPGSTTELLGVLLAIGATILGLRVGRSIASNALSSYDVAEVGVEGPIVREDGGSPLPSAPSSAPADEIVEQIERADEDGAVDALLLHLNTPGGEVVPSEDVRAAAEEFDGPTIAYTSDLCASGGMWIASGCDELWAREGSMVGSVGVRFSQTRFDEFAEEHGISYEGIVSGEFKDASGAPFKPLEDAEREYLQGLSDAWYEQFVDRVADATGLDAETVRDTEAKVYLGTDAAELGFVDELGDRDAVELTLAEELDRPEVSVERFEPQRSFPQRLQGGTAAIAYAFGAGLASVVSGDRPEMR
ncbi:S49 family peptidase [Salinarchaeum laminariae]|uniref:S49 family peptidase n=1 Tax=Salinarchaeum laminariae TaxID=869888 RepID=UPI0020C0292F|nr:S49 family peptidase [Salinarchaeum laminariae]